MDRKPVVVYVSGTNEHRLICIEPEIETKPPQSHLPKRLPQKSHVNPAIKQEMEILMKPEMETEQSLMDSKQQNQFTKQQSQHHPSKSQPTKRNVNPVGPHVCDQCNTMFLTANELIHHQLSKHPTTLCILCQKEFSSNSKWKRHVDSVHGFGQIFTCPFCDKRGYREDLIFIHIMNMHNMFPCRECKQMFPSKYKMDSHKKFCY